MIHKKMRLLFFICLFWSVSISVAGPVSQQLCGCPYACTTWVPGNFTCTVPVTIDYVQKIPYSCEENPQFCLLEAYSAITYSAVYQKQPFILRSLNSNYLYCYRSQYRCIDGSGYTFIGGFAENGLGDCVTADLPVVPCSVMGIYLDQVVPSTDTLYLESTLPQDGAFYIVPTLSGMYSAFDPVVLNACCQDLPADIYVETSCSTVLFTASGSQYVATEYFDVTCATTSEPVTLGTQYWFDAQILGYALEPCQANRINATTLNFTQIVSPTSAPTLFPTVDPSRLSLVAVESVSERDASTCPVTVSGFGRPRFATRAETDLTPEFSGASIWFPSTLYTVSASGTDFNVTSSACVAQDQNCRAYWTADVDVQATEGTVSYGAQATTDGSQDCLPRAQCYVGEAQNLNYERVVFLDVDWPASLDEYATFDLTVSVYDTEFVTFDTARMTYATLDGFVSYDVSSGYKASVMQNVSYPEYSEGLFCRYNDTMFFVAPRVNGWTAANLGALNATLCAYVNVPSTDRVMVIPSGVAYSSTYLSVTIEAFGQIRNNGTFVGCVYASKTITPIQPAKVVGLPAGVIVAAVVGSVGGVALMLLVRAWWIRRKRKVSQKVT